MYKKFLCPLWLFTFLFSKTEIYGQCTKKEPASCIEQEQAEERIDFFYDYKEKAIFEKMHISSEDFSFKKKVIRDFLYDFRGKDYDGVRIYFALSDDKPNDPYKPNTLYLVLVPTVASRINDEDDNTVSIDNIDDKAYIAGNGNFYAIKLSDQFVVKWMNRYTSKVASRVENQFLKKYNINLKESHSLWYSDAVLFKENRTAKDIVTYLDNDTDNKIESVKIDFASWPLSSSDPTLSFKLDLLFEFVKESGSVEYLTLATPEINAHLANLKAQLKAMDKSDKLYNKVEDEIAILSSKDFADTGIPCPPAKCP